jgi:hypothetical protein
VPPAGTTPTWRSWLRHLLGGKLQHGFDRASSGHINQLIYGEPRRLDQIDHWQQSQSVPAEKLRQPSRVGWSFAAESVIASSQGSSPFAEKVFQPDSTKNRVENHPSTFN